MKNVVTEIPHDICVGCGACVGACPMQHLAIDYNEFNQLEIKEKDNACSEKCSICTNICPFSNDSCNEDIIGESLFKQTKDIKHNTKCGYYLNSYVGFHPNHELRMNSASGGITSLVLAHLLETNEVDAAIVAGRKEGGKPYYTSMLVRNSEDVYKCSRSAYYAIHIGETLREVIANKTITSVAIVALPCLCKAIRNACKENAILRKKIKFVIGIVCGQQKSHNFAEYLGKKNGLASITSIDFRTKESGRPNGNYGVKLKTEKTEKEITFSDYSNEWSSKLFTIQTCNYCDDIFAETADMAVMDAWLPEYKNSDKGETLVITRNAELDSFIKSIPDVQEIGINRVLESQSFVIQNKRSAIIVALKQLKKRNIKLTKREYLYKVPSLLQRPLLRAKYAISVQSDKIWKIAKQDITTFNKKMRKYNTALFFGLVLNKIDTIICRLKNR